MVDDSALRAGAYGVEWHLRPPLGGCHHPDCCPRGQTDGPHEAGAEGGGLSGGVDEEVGLSVTEIADHGPHEGADREPPRCPSSAAAEIATTDLEAFDLERRHRDEAHFAVMQHERVAGDRYQGSGPATALRPQRGDANTHAWLQPS